MKTTLIKSPIKTGFFLFFFSLLIMSCGPQKIDINELSGLPQNLAENLRPSFADNGLKSFPNTFDNIDVNPDQLKPMVAVDKSCIRNYKFPVIYFLTHCKPAYEINFPDGGNFLKMTGSAEPSAEKDRSINLPKLKYYKLDSFEGSKISGPQVCQVYSVPWNVTIREEIFCQTSAPRHYTFLFDYPGDPIIFDWYGNSMGEIPIPTNMIKTGPLNFENELCSCCGVTYLCNGLCVPFEVTCDGQNPA